MKLYIDDIRKAPEGWTLVTTITGAIRFIALHGAGTTEISLDHDISHKVSVGEVSRPYPCDETFQAVAYFIAEYYKRVELKTPKITLHTANPVGAETMKAILKEFDVTIKLSKPCNRLEDNHV